MSIFPVKHNIKSLDASNTVEKVMSPSVRDFIPKNIINNYFISVY